MDQDLTIEHALGQYGIHFRCGAGPEIVERTLNLAQTGQVLVVSDTTVAGLYAHQFVGELQARGLKAALLTIEPGEQSKCLGTIERLYEDCINFGVDRRTPIIAYGGGVVGDLAGFLAATMLRGLPWAQVPTTVLSAVDSSVGGKVGVNLPHGKNLVGAFYAPQWVVIDTLHLTTLDEEQRRSGLAEAIKHGALTNPQLLRFISAEANSLIEGKPEMMRTVIAQAVAAKGEIVAADEREYGKRLILNFGHTLGHALEAQDQYGQMSHGSAVALGMRFALEASRLLLGLSDEDADVVNGCLDAVGLPSQWRERIRPDTLDRFATDKKIRGDHIQFVALSRLGEPEIVSIPLDDFRTLAWQLIEHSGEI